MYTSRRFKAVLTQDINVPVKEENLVLSEKTYKIYHQGYKKGQVVEIEKHVPDGFDPSYYTTKYTIVNGMVRFEGLEHCYDPNEWYCTASEGRTLVTEDQFREIGRQQKMPSVIIVNGLEELEKLCNV